MNKLETEYFHRLREIHIDLAKALDAPQIKGLTRIISNLYRDNAHFIYELIQNADDQQATAVKFMLDKKGLIFKHNSKKHFTISNPDTHEEDQINGRLGDVNAILSIASSNKNEDLEDIKIGKFGLGFKSVFLYTDTPHIYDKNVMFKITNYIVPELLESDHNERMDNETLFWFPFKAGEEEEDYKDILEKLKALDNPLLFLNHVKRIDWESEESEGKYQLEIEQANDDFQKIRSTFQVDDEKLIRYLWKFTKTIPENPKYNVAVVYEFDEEMNLITRGRHKLYCFLPTKDTCHLPVLIHAPFRLAENRESVKANDSFNKKCIELLSQLLRASLIAVCEQGEKDKKAYINDNLSDFVYLNYLNDWFISGNEINLNPLYEAIVESIKEDRVLWCNQLEKYLNSDHGFIPDNEKLDKIYPSPLLSEIFSDERGWVMTVYIPDLKRSNSIPNQLGLKHLSPENILQRIDEDILAAQDLDWLKEWYASLNDVKYLWNEGGNKKPFLRYKPIILTSEQKFVAPYTEGQQSPNVYLNAGMEDSEGAIHSVAQELLEDSRVKDFMTNLGLANIGEMSVAEHILLPKILNEENSIETRLKALAELSKIFIKDLIKDERKEIENKLVYPCEENGSLVFAKKDKVKVHNEINDFYFQGNPNVRFFEPGLLKDHVSEEEVFFISKLLHNIEELRQPEISTKIIAVDDLTEPRIPKNTMRAADSRLRRLEYEYFMEPVIQELKWFCENNAAKNPERASKILIQIIGANNLKAIFVSYFREKKSTVEIPPLFFELLKCYDWIEEASNELRELLCLPVNIGKRNQWEMVSRQLNEIGIENSDELEDFLQYINDKGIVSTFQQVKEIEAQRKAVSEVTPFSLKWFKEILALRLKYVRAGEKEDIERLIVSLETALQRLNLEEDKDVREFLPEHIQVVFGPPGTGKTTDLVRQVIERIEENPEARIMILTPTNGSANVIASRLSAKDIVVSRGINPSNLKESSEAEKEGCSIYDAAHDELPQVLVSTVHYFSQTKSFKEDSYLYDLPWDTIMIDEASMVTLDYVLFAILQGYQNNPYCRFVISGDPLQLPPITNLDPSILEEVQLDEFNIFSFLGINEFSEDQAAMPYFLKDKIDIRLLIDQYRSLPLLCNITGRFAYDSKLIPKGDVKPIEFQGKLKSIFHYPISFVRFPVSESKGEPSIFSLDKLKGSNYNLYSALLVNGIVSEIFNTEFKEKISIGIITPYVAQKKLMEKLLKSRPWLNENIGRIEVNTVHKFQGDEFDIVLLVLNPPSVDMKGANNMLLNKKYLINVAVSRAKKSMLVLYPDDSVPTEYYYHVSSKSKYQNIENIVAELTGKDISILTKTSAELETLLYGRSDYMEAHSMIFPQEDVTLVSAYNIIEDASIPGYDAPLSDSETLRFIKGSSTLDIIS